MNGSDNAYPYHDDDASRNGLTKREMLAAMAMQGILSSHPGEVPFNADACAEQAIAHADALLSSL